MEQVIVIRWISRFVLTAERLPFFLYGSRYRAEKRNAIISREIDRRKYRWGSRETGAVLTFKVRLLSSIENDRTRSITRRYYIIDNKV